MIASWGAIRAGFDAVAGGGCDRGRLDSWVVDDGSLRFWEAGGSAADGVDDIFAGIVAM